MTRKTYEVSSPHIGVMPKKTPDSSFKTCLCTMLVVLVICVLLFLMAFAYRKFAVSKEKEISSDNIASDALQKQYNLSSTMSPNNTRIINETTTTQTPLNIYNFDTEKPTTSYEEQTTTAELNSLITGDDITSTTAQVETEGTQTTEQEITKQTTTTIEIEKVKENETTTENDLKKTQTITEQHEITTIGKQMTTQLYSSSTTGTQATTKIVKSLNIISDERITENDIGATIPPKNQTTEECNSAVCISTAAHMLASMDLTQKPCENFYEYACGGQSGYEDEDIHVFSEKVTEQTDTPNFIKKFNMFYKSCLDHEDRFHYQERLEKVKDLLRSVGSYQMKNAQFSQNNLTNFVADLILSGVMPFFDVEVDIDPHNNTYILKLLKPDRKSLDLDHWSSFSEEKRKCIKEIEESESKVPSNISMIYSNMLNCQQNYSGFFDSISITMMELGFFSNLTGNNQTDHIFDIKFTIEWDVLSIIPSVMNVPDVEEEFISKKYKSMSLEELQHKFPQIKWSKLFELISNIDENNDIKVLVHDISYFEKVFDIFENSPSKNLNNAFLAILANSLYQNTVLPIHRHSRVKYCKEIIQELMPDIINYIHQVNNYNEEMVNSTVVVKDIFETLKTNFKNSLEENEWLDEFSKVSIREKVDNLNLVFNSDNLTSEKMTLENVYSNLTLDNGNYQANLFNLMKYSKRRMLSLYGQKVTPDNMYRNFVDITKKEPIFFYTSNIVCIPYGLIKKVSKIPKYVTLGQVGFYLAKIIGYSFDSIGMQYGVKLDDGAMQRFKEFSDESRDTVTLSDPIGFGDRKFNFKLNNALSQNERMAEKTAFRLLEDSLKSLEINDRLPWIRKNSTEIEIFLLAVTQEFCKKTSLMEFTIQAMESSVLPPQFRIENILSNSQGFLKEFNCKFGSGMIRMNSSSVFPYLKEASLEY